jgi:hypothetical protein
MMQRRGYFVSRKTGKTFRTWGQKQYKQALRQGHKPIVRKEWKDRQKWEILPANFRKGIAA